MSDKLAPCAPQLVLAAERPRYYQGQMLTAADFKAEQSYHLNRRYLLNRLLYGWGIVCGLTVLHHAESGDNNMLVAVAAGMAIDGCGREIISAKTIVLDLAALPGGRILRSGGYELAESGDPLLLCVRYCEELAGFVPAIGDPHGSEAEAGRILEKADFVLRSFSDMDPTIWESGERPCFVDETCPGAGLVPLAGLFFAAQTLRIDLSYRRSLAEGRLSANTSSR